MLYTLAVLAMLLCLGNLLVVGAVVNMHYLRNVKPKLIASWVMKHGSRSTR